MSISLRSEGTRIASLFSQNYVHSGTMMVYAPRRTTWPLSAFRLRSRAAQSGAVSCAQGQQVPGLGEQRARTLASARSHVLALARAGTPRG